MEVKYSSEWNVLKIDGGRKVSRTDIDSIDMSGSGNTFLIKFKGNTSIFSYPTDKCHFYKEG